jgi:hypothetical protein
MSAKEIQAAISAYNLKDTLEEILEVAIEGGCPPPSTIYAAFDRNRSPREKKIVEIASKLVSAHEAKVNNALAAATA